MDYNFVVHNQVIITILSIILFYFELSVYSFLVMLPTILPTIYITLETDPNEINKSILMNAVMTIITITVICIVQEIHMISYIGYLIIILQEIMMIMVVFG